MDPVVIFDSAANYFFCQGCFSLNFAKHSDFFERREIFANLEKMHFCQMCQTELLLPQRQ